MHATRLVPICLALLVGCGANVVAPPAAPMPDMPRVPDARTTAPSQGETRVTLDANGEKAVVTETLATVSTNETANVHLLTSFAIARVVTGGTLWSVGAAVPDRDDSHRNADFTDVGKYVLIGSAAAMTIGIVGQLLTRPVSQEGATTEIASR